MLALLTWPAYGTWFAHPARGWVDQHRARRPGVVPEPTRRGGQKPLKWRPARLDHQDQAVIVEDLQRIAALRGFELHVIVAASDHVHVLLTVEADRDVARLVQLIKGALSRALTVAAGDSPALSTPGRLLPHHKWWTRQYSFVRIDDPDERGRIVHQLEAHRVSGATVWKEQSQVTPDRAE